MIRNAKLTPERFEQLAWSGLLLRGAISKSRPDDLTFPNGVMYIKTVLYSGVRDTNNNKSVLEIVYEYSIPNLDYLAGLDPEIRDIWSDSKRERHRSIANILSLFENEATWIQNKPEAAHLWGRNAMLNLAHCHPLEFSERHLLQHLCRMQIALAAISRSRHKYRDQISEIVCRLQQLIDKYNRIDETTQGLMVWTPKLRHER